MFPVAFLLTAAAASPELDLTARREKARAVLKVHCGACHDPEKPTANARAMRIYNLAEPDFAARMTIGRLDDLAERLEQRATMSKTELAATVPRGAPAPRRPTETEIADLKVYVTFEQMRRSQ